MSKAEIETEMVSLQKLMEGLYEKELDAHKRKLAAEQEISAIHNFWKEIYTQYLELRNKLVKLNK